MKVFIVEDSEVFLGRLIALLHDFDGVELVGNATGAPEAIAAIARLQPDLVLLDLQLAEGAGLEVLQAVKTGPRPRVAVVTNFPEPPYRKACQDAGADFFFDKATAFDDLVALLPELLADA